MSDVEFFAGIERAYREAVSSKPYCSISVKYLCAEADVTRKAFYKRFDGKADVLKRVFDRDVVQPSIELCRLLTFERMSRLAPEMQHHMFQAVRDDGAFYHDVVTSPQGGEEAFRWAASTALQGLNRYMLGEYGFSVEPWKVDYVAKYFADAKTCLLADWIKGGYEVSVDDLSKLYVEMALPFWGSLSK